jgi:hypothetical protein
MHGFIKGMFNAQQLAYWKGYTPEITQIFPAQLDKNKPVSIQQACTAFGSQASCTCKGDCSKISRMLMQSCRDILHHSISQRERCKQRMHII